MSSTTRSLVLGAWSGLPVTLLEPFARSLRASGYRGSFCVVAGECTPEQRRELADRADAVVDVTAEYAAAGLGVRSAVLARMRRTRGVRRAYPAAFRLAAGAVEERRRVLEYRLEGLQTLRYAHYLRVLEERPADVVMITDLRDVYFQRDPFAEPVQGLEVYLEDDSVRIGSDDFNTRWIRDLYGQAGVEALRGRRVSCSGTVVGTRSAMLAYLSAMTAASSSFRRPMGPRDQAVHNRLLYEGRLSAVAVVANGYGRVLTLGKVSCPDLGQDGIVRNLDGTTPAVLHQWDRHDALVVRLERRPS